MNLLLLAGTTEARALARGLAGDPRLSVVASLAGATRAPEAYAVTTRMGGFGGEAGLAKYIKDNAVGCIIDATHPFARTMPRRAQTVCAARNIPYLRLLRPGWAAGPGDDWRSVEDEAATPGEIPTGARVFLATGRRSLERYAALAPGRALFARVIDLPGRPFPYPDGAWVVGRPPYRVDDEIRLFRELGIDVLVAKNAGGPTRAKLDAARALGLPVVMLRRPPPPPGDRVDSVAAALDWLEARL